MFSAIIENFAPAFAGALVERSFIQALMQKADPGSTMTLRMLARGFGRGAVPLESLQPRCGAFTVYSIEQKFFVGRRMRGDRRRWMRRAIRIRRMILRRAVASKKRKQSASSATAATMAIQAIGESSSKVDRGQRYPRTRTALKSE